MTTLVPHRRSWLASSPVAGSPAHWSRHTAAYGALVTVAAPMSAMAMSMLYRLAWAWPTFEELLFVPLFLLAMTTPAAVLAAIFGSLAGALQPGFADRVRGRVPLPVLVVGQSAVGAALGAATASGGFLIHVCAGAYPVGHGFEPWGQMVARVALYGGIVGAWAGLAWWLPFTVATVTGGRGWRVSAVAAATVPLANLLLWLLLA